MSINVLVERLEKVKSHGKDKYLACCPAHPDKTPSLALTQLNDGRVLIHCFAGCDPVDVLTAVGLKMGDLFPDDLKGEFQGWEQLKKKAAHREVESDKKIMDKIQYARNKGERISPQDLEIEKDAYMRVQNAKNN